MLLLTNCRLNAKHKVLFACKDSPILVETKFSFEDMADHRVRRRGSISFRSRLHDDVTHRHSFETRDCRRVLPVLTHSGHGLVSVLVCEAAGFTMMVEAAANPIANAERRSTLSIDSSRDVPRTALTGYRITLSTAHDRSETYWRAGSGTP